MNKIKPGYKKTSVGIIPEDWEVKKLISQAYVDKENINSDFEDEFINYVSLSDIKNGKILPKKIQFKSAPSRAKRITKKGDVLLATVRPNLKNFAIVDKENIIASTGFAVLGYKKMDLVYLYNFLYSHFAEKQYFALTVGSNYPALNSNDVKNLKLPIPPLPEQTAIADCLSTWDSGIEKLSALITAKKEQKKGLMQGIFSGKLKVENGQLIQAKDGEDFTKEWKEVKLGDIGTFRTSSVNKKIEETETQVWLLNYMDVYRNTHITSEIKFQQTSAKGSQIESSSLKLGDILFTPSSETPDDIGHSAVVTENLENVVFSYHLVRFRVKKNLLDIDFSGHVFNKSDILNEFSRRATGSTRYTLSLKDFNEVKIKLPELKEQKTISNVLSTADKEIELLEKKLEAFKIQKKGLMQVLLTGERRLVES